MWVLLSLLLIKFLIVFEDLVTVSIVKQLATLVGCELFPSKIYWSTTGRWKRKEYIWKGRNGLKIETYQQRIDNEFW